MIVYLVAKSDYDEFFVASVWSSVELAEAEIVRKSDEEMRSMGRIYGSWDWYDFEVDQQG